jgi:hypothetical protein
MTNKLILNRPGCGSKKTRDIKTSQKRIPGSEVSSHGWKIRIEFLDVCEPAINLHFSPFFSIFSPLFLHFSPFFTIFHIFFPIFHNFSPFFLHFSPFFTIFQPPCFTIFHHFSTTIFHNFSPFFSIFHHFSTTIFHNFSPFFTIFQPPFFTIFQPFFTIFQAIKNHHVSRGKHHPSDKNGLCGAHRPGARIAAVLLEVVGLGAMPGFGDPRMGEVMGIDGW